MFPSSHNQSHAPYPSPPPAHSNGPAHFAPPNVVAHGHSDKYKSKFYQLRERDRSIIRSRQDPYYFHYQGGRQSGSSKLKPPVLGSVTGTNAVADNTGGDRAQNLSADTNVTSHQNQNCNFVKTRIEVRMLEPILYQDTVALYLSLMTPSEIRAAINK